MDRQVRIRCFAARVMALVVVLSLLTGGCAPKVVKETVIVEKPVEKVVKEVVKETVIVEGTPVTVEKVITATPEPGTGAPKQLVYKGELSVQEFSTYPLPEALTDAQKAAGETGNQCMAEIIADWERMHPGIDVVPYVLPVTPEGAGIGFYVNTILAAGQGPDIVAYNAATIYSGLAGDKGVFVPLNAYLKRPNPYIPEGDPGSEQWVDLYEGGFNGCLQQTVSAKNNYYDVVFETVAVGILYNKDIFEEVGITMPVPVYLNDVLDILEKLRAAGYEFPIQSACCQPGPDWDSYFFEFPLVEPIALRDWQIDYKPEYLDSFVEAEEVARAFYKGWYPKEAYREWLRISKLWVPYHTEEWKLGMHATRDDFLNQRVPMRVSGTWELLPILANPDREFDVGMTTTPLLGPNESPLLTEENPGPAIGGTTVARQINAAAVGRGTLEAAIDLLQYLSAPATWSRLTDCQPAGSVPVIKGAKANMPDDVFEAIEGALPTRPMHLFAAAGGDPILREDLETLMEEYDMDITTLDEASDKLEAAFMRWVERAIEMNDKATTEDGTWDLTKW